MTKLIGIIKDSIGNPVTGYLTVKLNAPLIDISTDPDSVHYNLEYTYKVIDGDLEDVETVDGTPIAAGIELLPTDEPTYNFSFKYESTILELYLDGKVYASIYPNGESTGGDYHQFNVIGDDPDLGLRYYTGAVHSEDSELLEEFNRVNRLALFEPFNTNIPDEVELEWSELQHSSVNTSNINTSLQHIARLLTVGSNLQSLVSGIYNPLGDWNGSTEYNRGDVVYYDSTKGSYWYISYTPTTGTLPTNTTYWQKLVEGTEIGGVSADFLLDTIFGVGWNGVTNKAPTADKLYDYLVTLAKLDEAATFTTSLQAPTRSLGDNTTHVATTAHLQAALSALTVPPATTAPTIEQISNNTNIINAVTLKRITNMFARVTEEKPQNDSGGSGQGWRNLEFIKENSIYNSAGSVNMISVNPPYVTVKAGRYRVWGRAASCATQGTRLDVRTSTGVTLIQGDSEHNGLGDFQISYHGNVWSKVSGVINLSSETNIGLYHSFSLFGNSNDRGRPCGRGGNEIYAVLELQRINEAI
nr:hypothetical protein [uncultured Flavobacterium sp.]